MQLTMLAEKKPVVPFLKWAGGKRWLTSYFPDLFPENYEKYIEPFLGSGTVFFYLRPRKAFLSDINEDLIVTYNALKNDCIKVQKYLTAHSQRHNAEYYYKIRSSKPKSEWTRAARFIYLNRTCWNGLYRVNRKGEFNVPIGTKTRVLLDSDDFDSVSKMLKNAVIAHQDFEKSLSKAKENDFVFIDPPYTVKHDNNGFIKYNEKIFSWEDQERLRCAVQNAVSRGAKILVLNAAHDSIRNLYSEFKHIECERNSVLAGKAEFRGSVKEIAIKCGY